MVMRSVSCPDSNRARLLDSEKFLKGSGRSVITNEGQIRHETVYIEHDLVIIGDFMRLMSYGFIRYTLF
jgi:hypothetical protein